MADDKGQHTVADVMMNNDGKKVVVFEDKLHIFGDYYTELYKSLGPSEEDSKSCFG